MSNFFDQCDQRHERTLSVYHALLRINVEIDKMPVVCSISKFIEISSPNLQTTGKTFDPLSILVLNEFLRHKAELITKYYCNTSYFITKVPL